MAGSQKPSKNVVRPFRCPRADDLDCNGMFDTADSAKNHAAKVHGDRIPCTLAVECNCNETFISTAVAQRHADSLHRGLRFPCPKAEEFNCKATFSNAGNAKIHAESLHSKSRVPCPKAEGFNCKTTFSNVGNANAHAKKHGMSRPRYACPWAAEGNCVKTFADKRKANRHAKDVHVEGERERHPCPLATEEKCEKTFLYARTAMQHATAAHGYGQQHPCPYASEYNCSQVFGFKPSADRHGETHLEKRTMYPCPLASEYGCERVFIRKETARKHADTQHLGVGIRYPCLEAARFSCQADFADKTKAAQHAQCHTHPVRCSRQGCKARFETVEDAWAHENSPDHVSTFKLFVCTVPMCRIAVAGRRLVGEDTMSRHMKMHVNRGHVQDNVEYLPRQVEEMLRHSRHPLYWQIYAHNLTNEAEGREHLGGACDIIGALGSEENDLEDTPHASDEADETQDSLLSEMLEEELVSRQPGMFSEERCLCIQKQNTVLWNRKGRPKVSFMNLGLTCVGPDAISNGLVTQRCPNEVAIDLDTARLKPSSRPKEYLLSPRCATCNYHLAMTWFLEAHGVKLHADNIICTEPGCDQQPFHKSGMCCRHIPPLLLDSRHEKIAAALAKARKAFESAARKQWTYPPKYNIVRRRMDDILQNKRPGLDLVVLDDEYSPSSRQLWEFAMIEQISGDKIINTIVEHPNGVDHSHSEEYEHMRLPSKIKALSVYSPSRGLSIDRMDVHKIAATLRQKGVSRDTMFLVWHKHAMDLKLLRELLESSGYDNILPPDENCISLLHLFRYNIFENVPKDQQFHLNLEVVFPLMFPQHDLVGLNHVALVDCQQTRLICGGINQLCKPIEERGHEWQPDTVVRSSQTSILNWVLDRAANNGNESGKRKGASVDKEGPAAKRVLKSS